MKRVLPFMSLALVMAACNTTPQTTRPAAGTTDTSGLAQFQAWKTQTATAAQSQTVQYVAVPAQRSAPVKRTVSKSSGSNGTVLNSESSQAAKAAQKKGWSKAAKGAVIGGVAGAVGGAVINKKNRAAGAVIGGVIGAGGGYAIGRGMDKRDGRIDYRID